MPKNIEDIVVPSRKKSILDVPIPESRRKASGGKSSASRSHKPARRDREDEAAHETEEAVMPRINTYSPPKPKVRRKRKVPGKKFLFTGVVACALVLFGAMAVFAGATLTYTPKSVMLSFSGESYRAEKTGEGGLVFSVVKLSGDKGVEVPATGEENVERKASGTIVVYNNAGTAPQPLVATTRFESEDGKVYRIKDDITVPGRKTVGGDVVPGSIEVTVYADQPGAEYNIGLSDFTLPGLAGTSKFDTIYARSKTPMSGGFVGKAKAVSEKDMAQAKEQIESELTAELREQAEAQVPGDFVLFPSLSDITFEELPQSEASGDKVTVNTRGNFYGVMFKRSDLASFLARGKANIGEGDVVEIPDMESLSIAFDGEPPADLLTTSEVNFTVSGDSLLVWKTNEEALRADLAGLPKSEVSSILNNYPSIESADAVVRPFWKSSFPDEAEKISIKKASK